MTRNTNPIRIKDNNESPITTMNPSLITIHDVARNPNPKRIQDVIRNHNPPRIEDVARNPNPTWIQDVIRNPYPTNIIYPLTYNGSQITWAHAK